MLCNDRKHAITEAGLLVLALLKRAGSIGVPIVCDIAVAGVFKAGGLHHAARPKVILMLKVK